MEDSALRNLTSSRGENCANLVSNEAAQLRISHTMLLFLVGNQCLKKEEAKDIMKGY